MNLPVVNNPLESALAEAIEGEVRFSPHDRMLYATDASIYQVEPIGVVVPASTDDAVKAVRFCAQRRVPILPRGGGTSLAGQCTNHAVVIDFSANCRAIRRIDPDSRRCTVEAGVVIDELNRALAPTGLFFAPDPATIRQCNVGGCVGNNAAGARSIRYGRTSENLIGVEACLADGTLVMLSKGAAAKDSRVRDLTRGVIDIVTAHANLIRDRFPRTIRRNAGYALDMILSQIEAAGGAESALDTVNLAHLLCGSEGTLAVTLAADLTLHPIPKARSLTLIGFDSLEAAIDAVPATLLTRPTAVELLDDMVLHAASIQSDYRRHLDVLPRVDARPPSAVLYVEHAAEASESELDEAFAMLQRVVPDAPVRRCDTRTAAEAWALRRAGEPLLHGLPGHRKPLSFVEDNAVPVEQLARFVREFKQICERHRTKAAFWAHASVGVLHVRPMLDLRDPDDERRMHAIAVEAADLAKSCGGVMSGEHGDGRVRGPLLERHFGPELMRAFRRIKALFDPLNLLNPGNIVEPGPIESISQRTRIRPDDRIVSALPADTYFNFDDQDGLQGAVERCNGSGLCRKKTGGVMCPSYMATLDERHSTRGRANALRLAITGQFDHDWNDPETLETLDLCLSCKACKSECPSSVDVARLKAEYLAQTYRSTGRVPLASRAFARVRTLNRLGSLTPALANAALRSAIGRGVRRALGIHPQRSMPAFSRRLKWAAPTDSRPPVLVFADCFTTFNETRIGLAAKRILESFGYRPILADAGCCGRSMISLGLLDAARETIQRTNARLEALLKDSGAESVVFLEPSCLSAVIDDWTALKGLRCGSVPAKSMLLEQFLERCWDDHPSRPTVSRGDATVILHAHCHQKALWGADSSAAILRRFFPDRVETPDTGCCGMAGAFGMTRDRYDLSMKIGELTVFPAARDAQARGAILCAPGTSCRHQIKDGTGVEAIHPAEAIERAITAG